MLGHDVKHCASHFAVAKNHGEVDYQYGNFLHAMGGWPHFSPNKNAGPSAEWDQISGDLKNDGTSLVGKLHGETATEGMRDENPSTMDEGEFKNLGFQPKFQYLDNADSASARCVDEGNYESTPTRQKFQESNSVQREDITTRTAGLQTEVD
uniref:Uncharacterized protein n=1 Tax=Quercus lobata TaxID=97700 RepID=A0A7N2LSJ6_QUELO